MRNKKKEGKEHQEHQETHLVAANTMVCCLAGIKSFRRYSRAGIFSSLRTMKNARSRFSLNLTSASRRTSTGSFRPALVKSTRICDFHQKTPPRNSSQSGK